MILWILPFFFIASLQAVTLAELHGQAISQNRLLLQSESSINSSYQQYLQSQKWANPNFNVTASGFGRETEEDDNGIAYQLSQLIETGGKRDLRKRKAALAWLKAKYQHEINLQTLLNKLSKAYFLASYQEEKSRIHEERLQLLFQKKEALQEKVKLGKIKAFEFKQVSQLHTLQVLESKRLEREKLFAFKEIAFLTANPVETCERGCYQKPVTFDICPSQHPYLELLKTEREELYTQFEIEKAKQIPDFVVTGGYGKYFNCRDDYFIVGLDVPLPLFDQNQGNICSSSIEVERKDYEYESASKWIELHQSNELQAYESAKAEAELIQNELMPEARNQIQSLEEAEVDKTEIIEAKISLLDIEDLYLDALKELHERAINLKFLIYEGSS